MLKTVLMRRQNKQPMASIALVMNYVKKALLYPVAASDLSGLLITWKTSKNA